MCNYRRTSKLERFNFTETKKPIRGSSVCCSKVIHASDYAAVAVAIAAAIIPLATRTNAHIHSPLFPTAVFQRRVYARARAHARIPVSRTRFHIRKSMVTPNVPSETRYICVVRIRGTRAATRTVTYTHGLHMHAIPRSSIVYEYTHEVPRTRSPRERTRGRGFHAIVCVPGDPSLLAAAMKKPKAGLLRPFPRDPGCPWPRHVFNLRKRKNTNERLSCSVR